MSINMPLDFKCPYCRNKQKIVIWQSINVTVNPELKNKLLAAEINQFTCEKCGKKTLLNVPLLYHDMEKKFCVQYYPPEMLNDYEFLQQFNLDGSFIMMGISKSITKLSDYIIRPHIVFDMNEMVRYVAFREKIAFKENE